MDIDSPTLSYFLVRDIFLQKCHVYKESYQLHRAMHPEGRADLAWWAGVQWKESRVPQGSLGCLGLQGGNSMRACPWDQGGTGRLSRLRGLTWLTWKDNGKVQQTDKWWAHTGRAATPSRERHTWPSRKAPVPARCTDTQHDTATRRWERDGRGHYPGTHVMKGW